MDPKICLTTFVYGDKYQDYIPLVLYSIGKAYPKYSVIIFIYNSIRKDISDQLEIIKKFFRNFKIIENYYSDCKPMTSLKSKSLRWVLWDESFINYDYIYVIDIDILYIPEPIPLHEQHINHMKFIGSDCISNIKRISKSNYLSLIHLLRIIKNGGPKAFFRYFSSRSENKLSGLHFYKVTEYYKYINSDVRLIYKKLIYRNQLWKKTTTLNNEALLYTMLKENGVDVTCFANQSNSTNSLDFSEPRRPEFRPHHGIHLGIFRSDVDSLLPSDKEILESKTYKFYMNYLNNEIKSDLIFIELSKYFNETIKTYFNRINDYYS